jgi:hypothetical protein
MNAPKRMHTAGIATASEAVKGDRRSTQPPTKPTNPPTKPADFAVSIRIQDLDGLGSGVIYLI